VWSLFATQHEAMLHESPHRPAIASIGLLWSFNFMDNFLMRYCAYLPCELFHFIESISLNRMTLLTNFPIVHHLYAIVWLVPCGTGLMFGYEVKAAVLAVDPCKSGGGRGPAKISMVTIWPFPHLGHKSGL